MSPVHRTDQALVVSEIFGPTFQGEGPSLGRHCWFLRLGRCNLHCTWCDTAFTWDWRGLNGHAYDPKVELSQHTTGSLLERFAEVAPTLLVVSGGEPMLQQRGLVPLLRQLVDQGWSVEVETAATVAPLEALTSVISHYNASPKLANSGNAPHLRHNPTAMDALQASGKTRWKFVVTSVQDLLEIDVLAQRHSLAPIYVMPEGTTPEAILSTARSVADAVVARGWNMTTRLHILLYGDRRGI